MKNFGYVFQLTTIVFCLMLEPVSGQESQQYRTLAVEGWQVEFDERLMGDSDELGSSIRRVVGNQLFDLKMRLPADRVSDLQRVAIRIDLAHELKTAQYHPNRRWLESHGYDPELTRKIHIPNAQKFMDLYRTNSQPYVILHELAHAYHDQKLGFESEEIRVVFQQVIADGKYDSVLHIDGHRTKHYLKTNHKEYFAEMSESFLGTNDFYPFVRGELKEYDHVSFQLLKKIWLGAE